MKKLLFIIGQLCRFRSLKEARFRWELRRLEVATRKYLGVSMGHFRASFEDKSIFPNE